MLLTLLKTRSFYHRLVLSAYRSRLIELRNQQGISQRDLAHKLQLAGYDMDKNVITRIETNKRYVTDIELRALSEVLGVSYAFLIDGEDK